MSEAIPWVVGNLGHSTVPCTVYLLFWQAVKEAENSASKLSQEKNQLQQELKTMESQKEEARTALKLATDECDKKLAGKFVLL